MFHSLDIYLKSYSIFILYVLKSVFWLLRKMEAFLHEIYDWYTDLMENKSGKYFFVQTFTFKDIL